MPPSTANEVLILFSQALSSPAESEQQANILTEVKQAIEAEPSFLPVLYSTILSVAGRAGPLLKRWIADIVEFTVARLAVLPSPISPEQRAHLTIQSIDAILVFLETQEDLATLKLGIQCFATAYPLIFRHACGSGSDPRLWEKASRAKSIALLAWRTGHTGIRIAAMKVVQKIIQSQTRGSQDPRLQNRGDINLAMCPSHHPFMKPAQLEDEANKLLTEAITLLYTSNTPDIISSVINTFSMLVKARPTLASTILAALNNWAPSSISTCSYTQIRSVEKTLRLALIHLLRSGQVNAFASQINDCLHRQEQRMRHAADLERRRKEEEASLKRQRIADDAGTGPYGYGYGGPSTSAMPLPAGPGGYAGQQDYTAAKRRKLHDGPEVSATPPPSSSQAVTTAGLADFDIKSLKAELVLELIIANLQVMPPERVQMAVEAARANLADGSNPITRSIEAACRWTNDDTAGPSTISAAASQRQASQQVEEQQPETNAVKEEEAEAVALDPLNMELDEDDLEGRARDAAAREKQDKADLAAAEAEVEATASSSTTTAAAAADRIRNESESAQQMQRTATPEPAQPTILPSKVKKKLLHGAVGRICAVGISTTASVRASGGDQDLWIQLITRLVTRGLDGDSVAAGSAEEGSIKAEKDAIRKQMFDFVTADMGERIELARLWLNEEWFTETKPSTNGAEETAETAEASTSSTPSPYEYWLHQILDFITTRSMDKQKGAAFTQFLVDLPEIPKAEIGRLAKMCTDSTGGKIGFATLRDLALLRPPLRQSAMDVLLSLTTHADKPTRNIAILTIKKWVPDVEPLASMGQAFALHLLERLKTLPTPETSRQGSTMLDAGSQPPREESAVPLAAASTEEESKPSMDGIELENEDKKDEASIVAVVENGKVVGGLPIPKTEAQVAQHIELLLGLVSKAPDLLDELFKAYPRMSPSTQETVKTLFTPLIRHLGPSHPKVTSLIREYPEGSEELALRMLNIFTGENGKLPPSLTALIKSISQEGGELKPRFVIPIIADLDKNEILKHLPRILSLLNGKQSEKELIRSVLQSVVTTPPQSFGHVSTNVVRVRQSELLTPVELLVLIHLSEKEIGIKQSIEAVGICFSMTEAFRPEVLGAFMQQIVDEATLPTLFMRTVIQAVTTYKSLQPYVSNTLLSRLITKKIWTMPQLWQGFIRCAKVIAPNSFGAILQLPREQIKEVVTKQPDLREGLKEYVLKRAGPNKSRTQGLLEVLEGTSSPGPNATA